MSPTRKTAKDYRNELTFLNNARTRFENCVNERLLELSQQYPDCRINTNYDLNIPINNVMLKILNKSVITSFMDINDRINAIEEIEQWLADKEQYKQGKLF